MAPSFNSLLYILTRPESRVFRSSDDMLPPGEHQYFGLHFLAFVRYAIRLGSNTLASLDDSNLYDAIFSRTSRSRIDVVLNLMKENIIEILGVHQYSLEITPKTVDTVASFIDFLMDALEKLLLTSSSHSWIIIPSQTNILCKRLKFLNVFLLDAPFQCTNQEESSNILAEIESATNGAGNFLYSFFLTTDHVTITAMDLELSILLSKLEAVEDNIKKHCATVFEQLKFKTPKFTSVSMYMVDSLLDDLNHLLNHKVDLLVEVKDQLTTFHKELHLSRSMLNNTDLMQNKELIKYEIQLMDLAYEAEYIMAHFAAGEVPSWYLSFRLHSFIQKSNPIRASLTKLKLNSGHIDVRVTEGSCEVFSSQVVTKSIHIDEIIVGFEEARRQIGRELIGGPNHLQIIAIIGMGGLGKTTIARKLYNDPNVKLRFDRRSWCVVSQTYQKRKLLEDILSHLSSLKKDEISRMEDHLLADRVHKSLKRIRYLLVVDDIWNQEAWDDIKRYFPDDKNGSRILFTSRNKDVALQCSSEPVIHALPLLSKDECWNLLQKKVFLNSFCPQELQEVGKDIASNCKGLPLAVVGIAAILANIDRKESLWREIATNLISYISKDQDILELSYLNLPSNLKPCFLFLGMFEEDKEIEVTELLYLWGSEGLIPRSEHEILQDIAKNYLLELVNRSMVQVVKQSSNNGVKTFIMHDLIRDMCLRLGHKENFTKVINKESSTYGQHHHICIHSDFYDFTSRQLGLFICSLFCAFDDLPAIASSMKRLRVLKLLRANMTYDGTALSFLARLRHVECAGALYNFGSHMNLEFLSTAVLELPRGAQLDMPKLRCLSFSRRPQRQDISKCPSLQTLSGITIRNLEDIERCRQLFQLRHLNCFYEGFLGDDPPKLISLTQIVSLRVCGSYGTTFKANHFPIHIKVLSLNEMELSCRLLSSIGIMPQLEILQLSNVTFEENIWNTNDGEFQTLKFLKIETLKISEWNISEDNFPVLEHLVLRFCPDLKLIPSDLGYIPTLQRIEVLYCTEDVRNSARHIKEEQEEAGNEQLEVIIFGAFDLNKDEVLRMRMRTSKQTDHLFQHISG